MTSTSHDQDVKAEAITSIHRATVATMIAACAFCAFFELTKVRVISNVNPFAQDPYDVVGSFAIQVALLVSILNLARSVRSQAAPPNNGKLYLIVRGIALVLAAIAVTIITDTLAEVRHPSWGVSIWGMLLVVGLSVITLLTLAAGVALLQALTRLRALRSEAAGACIPAGQQSLGEVFDDLLFCGRQVTSWLIRRLPWLGPPLHALGSLCHRIIAPIADQTAWLNPRIHPWRFCLLIGLAAGVLPVIGDGIVEGIPPNPIKVGMVLLIFITVETAAVLLGFLLLGGFLGIRPPLRGCNRM